MVLNDSAADLGWLRVTSELISWIQSFILGETHLRGGGAQRLSCLRITVWDECWKSATSVIRHSSRCDECDRVQITLLSRFVAFQASASMLLVHSDAFPRSQDPQARPTDSRENHSTHNSPCMHSPWCQNLVWLKEQHYVNCQKLGHPPL